MIQFIKERQDISNEYGYDGQFYYRLDLDQFINAEKVHGLSFDHPLPVS